VVVLAVVAAACGGEPGVQGGQDLLPSVTLAIPLEQLGLRDLECATCSPYASLETLESLDRGAAASLLSADTAAAELLDLAGERGYGDVVGGVEAGYADGSGWVLAVLSGESDTAAGVVSASGSLSGTFLIEYDPVAASLTLGNEEGQTVIDLVSGEVSSSGTYGSCSYWHCVSAAISWLLDNSIGAYLIVYGGCEACALASNDIAYKLASPVTCSACMVVLAAVMAPTTLAGLADCVPDPCRWCTSSLCGDDEVTGRACQYDATGLSPTCNYVIVETYDEYYCTNPSGYQHCATRERVRLVEGCPYGCDELGPDGECAGPPPTCDPAACEQSTPVGSPRCELRPDDGVWVVAQDYDEWHCRPIEPRGEACVNEYVTRAEEECEFGCAADGQSCATTAACSAWGMSSIPIAQDLPAAVETTRAQIIAAAVVCDYDTLADLVSAGTAFSYSLGESGDPIGYWQSLEENGTGDPLQSMVVTLNLAAVPAGVGGEENVFYLWSDGPGGATEYRIGIASTGEWLFFLADD
jgi:hypothetical protein